jgi:hypothetical protein
MDFPVLNIEQSPLVTAKHIRDLDHSALLKQQSYVFNDGDDEILDIFAIKVGVNGNGFGVGSDTFGDNVDHFMNLPIIVDPLGITHKNGMRTKEFIEKNQPALEVGRVTKIKKYDLDNDGKIDFARVLGHISKDPEKKAFYHSALAAGINETSPTIQPLNFSEDVTNMLSWKPMNIAIVKDGAYIDHAKIKAICKGKKETCMNALAAAIENNNKTDTTLINVLTKSGYMSDPQGSNPDASKGNNSGVNTGLNPNNPLVNISLNGQQGFNPNSGNPTKQGESEQPQPDKKPEDKPQEDPEKVALVKQNNELKEGLKTQLIDAMVPIDLFSGDRKEDDRNAFLKEHFKTLTLEETTKVSNVLKAYLPKFLPFYIAKTQKQAETGTETKGDSKDKKEENPLAASLTFPKFDNNASEGEKKQNLYTILKKHSLEELESMDRKTRENSA